MEGLREQRSNSGNDQRDNLLDSLHECDAYKELKEKKSGLDDIHNFYSRLEEGFEYPESLINGFTREITEKYDNLVEQAFLAYGMDREFIMNHRYDIRYRMLSCKVGYEHIEVELMPLPVKLFSIHREYRFVEYPINKVNHSHLINIEGYLQLFMEHEGIELEEIKQHIQNYYDEEKNK